MFVGSCYEEMNLEASRLRFDRLVWEDQTVGQQHLAVNVFEQA